jgi:hypothetical protein
VAHHDVILRAPSDEDEPVRGSKADGCPKHPVATLLPLQQYLRQNLLHHLLHYLLQNLLHYPTLASPRKPGLRERLMKGPPK